MGAASEAERTLKRKAEDAFAKEKANEQAERVKVLIRAGEEKKLLAQIEKEKKERKRIEQEWANKKFRKDAEGQEKALQEEAQQEMVEMQADMIKQFEEEKLAKIRA